MKKTVLITGGTRGIGKAVAIAFANRGLNVAVCYRSNDDSANELKEYFDRLGASVEFFRVDVSNAQSVCDMVDGVKRTFGGVDVLVANAGISLVKQINDTTESEWDRIFDVNVKGVFNCVKAVLPNMLDNKWGRIITVSSVWGEVGASCEVAYSASKSAVIGFTKALAKELAPSGITVNCVSPGVIDTDMNACFSNEERIAIEEQIPLCRYGTPNEVAEAVLFLSSEGAGYVTGEILGVNGGFR